MWRGLIGLLGVVIGAVWIGQGVGRIHGSFMTGHSQYTVLGVIVAAAGLAMLGWFLSSRRRGRAEP